MKRILSLLVAMVMTLGCVGISAMAEENVAEVTTIEVAQYENFAAAMAAANQVSGAVEVEIDSAVEFKDGMELNGNYTSISFVGKSAEAKITINQTAGGDYLEAHGKTVAFTDLTLAKANPAWSGNSGHMGNYFSVQGGTVTYTDCIFPNGACTSTGTATYNNCTFQNALEYGLWVYDDALVTVNGGTIDSTKGIKVYSEGEDSVTSTLTVQNATFTENVTAKPAVAIGYAESITLIGNTYNNTTGVLELDSGSDADCEGVAFVAKDANGNDIANTLTAVNRSNSNAACGVLVDGKIYTTVATAAKEATSGSTVTLLHNSAEAVELPEGVTLNANGYTAENVTVKVNAPVEVETYEELVAALAQGGNIILTADITTTAALAISGVTATIDLNEKTLSVRAGDNKFIDASNITIKNGTINIDGVTVKGNAMFCLDEYEETLVTTLTLENVDLEGKDYSSAYGVFYIGDSSVLNVNGGNWALSNEQARYSDGTTSGGVFKADSGSASLNITGTTMELYNVQKVITHATTTIADSNISIKGDAEVSDKMEHGINRSALTITGSTITMENLVGRGITAENGAVSISDNSAVTITNAQEATIDVRKEQTVTVSEDSTVSVDKEPTITSGSISGTVVKVTTGLTGSGTEADPYLINNLNELIWFRDTVNTYQSDGSNQFKGKYVKLNADIDLADENWEPIGTNSVGDHMAFLGTFDGGNHTISNLYINADGDHLGFFARVGNYSEDCTPTIKNLKFNNVDVSANVTNHWTTGHGDYVGGVIANAGGNSIVSNVTVDGDVYVVGCGYVGGIVGHGYPDIDNCHVKANDGSYLHAGYWCAGGIIGYAGEGGTPITNCSVSGLDIWSAYGAAAAVAGLLQDGNTVTNVSAENVEITSNSDYCMGYIAGNGECSTMTKVTVTNVTATAKDSAITATDAVAEVNGSIYFNLQEALKALTSGATLKLLADVTITETWDCRNNGAKITVPVTIDGNGKTLKLTGAVDDKNWNTVFRLEADSTVKNLTIDVSEATDVQRGISTKLSITAENCNFIGNGTSSKRAIIFGESAGTDISNVVATITDCTFTNWSYGVSDNQSGKDAKSVTITDSEFSNASVLVSASETVTFTDNKIANGYVNIKSYTTDNTCNVTATGNTLDLTKGEDNKIDAGGEITAQDGFVLPVIAPSGSINGGLVNIANPERTFLAIESWIKYANESIVIKVYDANDTLLSTSSLVDDDRVLLGKKDFGLSTMVGINCTDKWWNTVWETGKLNANFVPAKATLFVDGVEMNTAPIKMRATGTETEVVWAEVPGVHAPELPNADVTVLEPITLAANSYMAWPSGATDIDRPLEIVMNFKANDTVEESIASGYNKWLVDFNLKFTGLETGSITADNCYLAGNYGTFGWIVIPTDGLVLEEGVSYPVVAAYDASLNYNDICTSVKDFTAAIHVDQAILDANPNFKVELSLVMTNPDDPTDTLIIGEPAVYTAEDLKNEEDEKGIFGTPFYMINLPQPDEATYKVGLYSGIDSLDYKEVGFRVFTKDGTLLAQKSTKTVYTSVKGNNMTLTAEMIEAFRIYGAHALFPVEWDNIPVVFQPYAIDLNGKEILGHKYQIDDVYTK